MNPHDVGVPITACAFSLMCWIMCWLREMTQKRLASFGSDQGLPSVHRGRKKRRGRKKQRAAVLLIAELDHSSGLSSECARNELRKWPGRCGLHRERGLTRTTVRLCLLGRNGQGTKGLPPGSQSSRQLHLQLLLPFTCCHVQQPRLDQSSICLGLALPFGFWVIDGFSHISTKASIDQSMTFKLVVLYNSHRVDVLLQPLNFSPANSLCDATALATRKGRKANNKINLRYKIAGDLPVDAQCDAKLKAAVDVNRSLAIKQGDSLFIQRTAYAATHGCLTRLVEGYGPRQNSQLHNAIVCTGAVLFGASAISGQQFLCGTVQWLLCLVIGSCQTIFELELFRLASLADWPHLGKLSALRCSSAGFYRETATGTTIAGDEVACFSCGCTVGHWTIGVHPMALHRGKCAQHCHFVMEPLRSGNVPIGKDPVQLPISEHAGQVIPAPSSVSISTAEIQSAADCMRSLGLRPLTPPAASALGEYAEAGFSVVASGSSLVKELRRTFGVQSASGSAPAAKKDELAKYESYRLGTFADVWMYDHIVHARELARNGFFYAGPGDRVQCAFCQGLLRNWELGDRIDELHARHFTYCRFVQGHDVGNVPIAFWSPGAMQTAGMHAADTTDATRADLGITCTVPKNPEFAIESRRLSTFATWPATHHLQPQVIAKAGFFYLGKEDAAQCFFCDGTVADWRANCDPWVEHAQCFPSCSFLLQVKGHDFVQRHRVQDEPAALTSNASFAVDPREVKARMDSNKVRILLQMDYPLDLIREVVQKRLATLGSDHETTEQLLDDVFRTHDEKQKASSAQSAGRRAMPASAGPLVTSRRRARGEGEPDVQSVPSDFSRLPLVAVAASASAAPNTGGSSAEYNRSAAANKGPPLISLLATSLPPEEENRQLKTQLTCKVCMDSLVGIVFLPCGHLVCCASCAPAMTACPICRVGIRGTVRTIV